jgi:hypothetical protein
MAAVLGVQPAYFFPEGGNDAAPGSTLADDELSRFIASNEGQELNMAFARIGSLTVRRKIVALVKSIAG